MATVHEFKVDFPEREVEDLRNRLKLSRYPSGIQDASWDVGTPLNDINRLTSHWSDSFDFKKAADNLNKFPQYTTEIQCEDFDPLQIHFVHQRSSHADAIPLLFSHGWPGSFMEVTKIISLLTAGEHGPYFHVVAPSLPNFGFSDGVRKRGFSIEQYAETCYKLMKRLGYSKFATQGGDWGWYVTRTLSLLYPEAVFATHFNMDVGDAPEDLQAKHPDDPFPMPDQPTDREIKGKDRSTWFEQEGFGYNLLQSTKPQTLAYAITDSPVGLLAWIYEKLHDWSDTYPWTDDEICTWISIYWFSTAGPGAAAMIYYEMTHDKSGKYVSKDSMGTEFAGTISPKGTLKTASKVTRRWLKQNHNTGVLIGQSHFSMDIHVLPSAWTKTIGDVIFEKEHAEGGHFAAYEKPEALARDLREMFEGLSKRLDLSSVLKT